MGITEQRSGSSFPHASFYRLGRNPQYERKTAIPLALPTS
jgi:hypothetical protein